MKNLIKKYSVIAFLPLAGLLIGCKNENRKEPVSEVETEVVERMKKENFGTTPEGEQVELYTLRNRNGMEVEIMTYGGIIKSLTAPDKSGTYEDVVLGFDQLSQYTENNPYFGAIIGRYGNRISEGKFSLDGTQYTLATNDGANHLHGGERGFDKVVWEASDISEKDKASLKLKYVSKDGEEGYPGNLETFVTYTLNNDNSLEVTYEATTDKTTIVNLTQHSYFNLSGNFDQDILDHQIRINADTFLPVDPTLIPTGELREVAGTPFDFREAKSVGRDIDQDTQNDQLKRGLGYDHCWVLNGGSGQIFAASAYHPETGRLLEIYTDEPGIQFYSGNFLDGTLIQKGGEGTYAQRSGFCLETQHYPDSPNQEGFPSVVLKPGEKYSSSTTFKFLVK